MLITTQTKLAKSHFKCFHCKLVTARKDGNWVDWDEMQVHLCPECDRSTAQNKERSFKN